MKSIQEEIPDIVLVFFNHTDVLVIPKNDQIRSKLFYNFKYTHYENGMANTIYLYRKLSSKKDRLPIGLLHDILIFANDNHFSIEVDPYLKNIDPITKPELQDWILSLNLPFELRDFQFEMVYDAIKYKKLTMIAATSSGKSLVIYCLIRWFTHKDPTAKKFLIVPSVLLVDQMLQDFEDYSELNGWSASLHVAKVYAGNTKYPDQNIIISTWQSLQHLPKDHFKNTKYLLIDEVHGSTAAKLKQITKQSINAEVKIGTTGTLKANNVHEKEVKSLFGVVKTYITAKQLIERGLAPPLMVYALHLKYSDKDRSDVSRLNYLDEVDWICENEKRKQITCNIPKLSPGNNLYLFNFKEKHLYPVFKQMSEMYESVEMITGSIPRSKRMQIKMAAEKSDGLQLCATFGTMSTGVSIKKLNSMIFCQCSKSNIRVIQSIGRILRMHHSIETVNVFILIDDLEWHGKQNAFLKHALETLEIIKSEGHEIIFKTINL